MACVQVCIYVQMVWLLICVHVCYWTVMTQWTIGWMFVIVWLHVLSSVVIMHCCIIAASHLAVILGRETAWSLLHHKLGKLYLGDYLEMAGFSVMTVGRIDCSHCWVSHSPDLRVSRVIFGEWSWNGKLLSSESRGGNCTLNVLVSCS